MVVGIRCPVRVGLQLGCDRRIASGHRSDHWAADFAVQGLSVLLEITRPVEDVAQFYIDRLVMPNDPGGDALHLALAVVHRVDVLLTWNCRHLANPSKMEHVRLVNH